METKLRCSTELGLALRWADLEGEIAKTLAPILKMAPKEVEGWLANSKRTAARLEDAKGPELALLEMLVEGCGSLPFETLVRFGRERWGWSAPQTEAVARSVEGMLLALRVHTRDHWRGQQTFLGLLDLAADAIAERVLGISLPADVPPADHTGTPAVNSVRETLAIVAATAHITMRTTQRFDVNRMTSKKLASTLGVPEARITGVLDSGLRRGVFDVYDGVALPRPRALRAIARGDKQLGGELEEALAFAWTPEDRWIPREALVRAVAARLPTSGSQRMFAEAAVARVPLRATTWEGHAFVRRGSEETVRGSGDGHITPSFEIMLGPRADPEILAVLALAAAPVRLDRVITLKLGPSSVAAAVACGLGWEEIRRALEAVGPHPVPENVATMVREWTERARIVRLRRVWALDCSTKDAADVAETALGDRVAGRPTPTLILVSGDLEPVKLLAKAGVRVIVGDAVEEEDEREEGKPPAIAAAPRILAARGDRALAARLADARIGVPTSVEAPASLGLAIAALSERPEARSVHARRFIDLLVEAAISTEPELSRWMGKLAFGERSTANEVIRTRPLDFLDWLVSPPSARRRLCEDAETVGDLVADASMLSAQSHLGNQIDELIQQSTDVRRMLGYEYEDEDNDDELPRIIATTDLEPQSADEVQKQFAEAVQRNQVLVLRVSSKTSGERVVSIAPERIITRGADVMLLGVDAETQENRSYPLRTILAARIRP